MSSYLVIRSGLIETRQEAVDYFAARIAGTYDLLCYRKPVRVRIPREGTHFYSEEVATPFALAKGERVVRRMAGGREEVRAFSLDRARLLDHMIPAIERFTVSIAGTAATGREKRMLHGPALPDGRYLRVVLRPDDAGAWIAVSAYPLDLIEWKRAVASKRAKFPP